MTTSIELPAGPFTYAESRGLGMTRTRLRRAVEAGQVRRLLTSVYVAASVQDSMDLRIRAAALVLAPGHIACDRTAAWLHGVNALTFSEQAVLPAVEACVLRGAGPTRRADVRGRTRDLAPEDIVDLGRVEATSPLRTALDLGCNLRRRDALAAMDQLRRTCDIGLDDLLASVPRFFRRRGVIQLRELAILTDPRSESPRESWTRLALHDAGLPAPELQWWVEVDGVPTYRLDLAYPRHRLAIEYDGAEFHDGERERERDLLRRERLREMGWTVVVVRIGDFTGSRLHDWIAQVRRILEDRPSNLRW